MVRHPYDSNYKSGLKAVLTTDRGIRGCAFWGQFATKGYERIIFDSGA